MLPLSSDLSGLQRARQRLFGAGFDWRTRRATAWGTETSSQRFGSNGQFLSPTQTGGKPELAASDHAWVLEADVLHNRLHSTGETKPSSESLTHALLYQLSDAVISVVHVHCPRLWAQLQRSSCLVRRPLHPTAVWPWSMPSVICGSPAHY